YRRREYSYVDAGRVARGFAARLAAAGLAKGDKVVFWGENRPEWVVCYWGCLLSGIVVVPIDYRSTIDFVERVNSQVRARLILVGDDVDRDSPKSFPHVWKLADLDWTADGPMQAVPIARDDVTQIIFTSGATAEPKGVVIRHRNVLANIVPVEREVMKYRKYARPFHPLRFLNLLPLSHMFGQSMASSIPPMVRGTVIFTRSFNPHDILGLIHRRRVSVLVCVPKILGVLREHVVRAFPEAADPPPPGISIPGRWWKYRRVHRAFGLKFWAFVVGAAPLPPDLEEFWRRLGFAVIQGYGLTETAPIVTLNHPFKTSKGSVGTPIEGVEVRIAEDGEILVRGENVTSGYYDSGSGVRDSGFGAQNVEQDRIPSPESRIPSVESRVLDSEGWLHTGDIGERDAQGRLFIKGRKKEMIVRPDGLNVFPEDVERALEVQAGVRESAVVGAVDGAEERVHAVLVLEPDAHADAVIRHANALLQEHQRIRTWSIWPTSELPRTEGTKKLKRRAIRDWVQSGGSSAPAATADTFEALLERFAHGRALGGSTTLEELGLSSLERVELMVALEDRFQTRIDEGRFSEISSIGDLKQLVEHGSTTELVDEPVDFPVWNRRWPVTLIRRLSQATWILPLARVFAHARVDGLEHLQGLGGPVVFASNHQSHMDVPVILSALPGRWRARVAPAMAKEFFKAHFFPAGYTWRERFTNGLNYYLAAFYFNAFPLPQREAGARQTLQYIGELTGERWSILIFPEGLRSSTGDIKPFRGGIGMIGSRLDIPIVPVRIDDVDKLLPVGATFIRPGRVRVAFGAPLRLRGSDYADLASQVERAVRTL
ncbi:MAG TPA: AMP-binding protein, partial [Vicinamibacterales bacterium]|nr:AMP-binding protein [Vicinamibacterales bacterium]